MEKNSIHFGDSQMIIDDFTGTLTWSLFCWIFVHFVNIQHFVNTLQVIVLPSPTLPHPTSTYATPPHTTSPK